MILKGNQRAGGAQMAKHLLNSGQNEHVKVHEVSGFIASDVMGALNEAYALSKGTKCKQFMYALSLSPPENEKVPVAVFENALERIEKKLGWKASPVWWFFMKRKAAVMPIVSGAGSIPKT